MRYTRLGESGLFISRLSLGAMTFLKKDNEMASVMSATGHKLADRLVGMAVDSGINLFDTSNSYGMGESESILGRALGTKRKDNLIATKLSRPMSQSTNAMGVSRLSVMREVEDSLRRLNTDYIDLYQIHVYDEETPMEETLRAMDDLVRQGKVRYLGVSNFTGWQIAHADGLARQLGTQRFCSLQAYYSLVGRDIEKEMLPATRICGMGTIIWSPLAAGFLTGKYKRDGQGRGRLDNFGFPPIDREQGFDILDALAVMARDKGVEVAHIAIAWLLHKPGVSTVLFGATSERQLRSNLEAAEVTLSSEEMTTLDEISATPLDYPYWIPKLERGKDFLENLKTNILKDD